MNTELIQSGDGNSGVSRQQGAMSIATSREAQSVQAAMVVAKQFPRDETEAIGRIKRACKRPALAEVAIYQYPRGGTKVEGPSIRLAEAMAQAWGNIDYGLVELESTHGESKVLAYAFDLETNTRRQMVFNVPHVRSTKQGNKLLTDPRDIYEMVANQGARRVRACILGVIPGDIQDLAVFECEKTLAGQNDKPIEDRVRDMVIAFKDNFGVTREMIQGYLGYDIKACNERDFVRLRKVFVSLKDGVGNREDFFTVGESPEATESKPAKSRAEAAKSKMAKKPEPEPEPAQEDEPVAKEAVKDFKYFDSAIRAAKSKADLEALVQDMQGAELAPHHMEELANLYDQRIATLSKDTGGMFPEATE